MSGKICASSIQTGVVARSSILPTIPFTPLHTLVPHKYVDYLHPNSVIAIAASVNQEKLTKEIYSDDVIYIPWQRPGFDIGLKIEQLIKENPNAKGILSRFSARLLP